MATNGASECSAVSCACATIVMMYKFRDAFVYASPHIYLSNGVNVHNSKLHDVRYARAPDTHAFVEAFCMNMIEVHVSEAKLFVFFPYMRSITKCKFSRSAPRNVQALVTREYCNTKRDIK